MGLLDRAGLNISPRNAKLTNVSAAPGSPDASPILVQFNPTEYGIDRSVHYADLNVPGLGMPLLQFVRGETQTLNLELLLDAYDQRTSTDPEVTVAGRLAKIRKFVQVDPELHAPPVCKFEWYDEKDITFTGVVAQMREKYTLFDDDGKILRARITLTIKSYEAPEVQLRDPARRSPDRTRVRALRERETLAHLSTEAYGNPRLWRNIATANDVERPRFVPPGTPLKIPAVT